MSGLVGEGPSGGQVRVFQQPSLPEHFEPELCALVYFIYWDFIYDYLQSFTDKVKLKGNYWNEDL